MDSIPGKRYFYVGDPAIAAAACQLPAGTPIQTWQQLDLCLRQLQEERSADQTIVTTYIIDHLGQLFIAPRRSEHVACAAGQPVAAAGELAFQRDRAGWYVVGVTNQSTGYCPEPTCWPAVAQALQALGVRHPAGFTQTYLFRRCPLCQMINIVKDAWFYCGVCQTELPQEWNF